MFGVLLVLLSVIVICVLIVKKFYPAWSLFVVGLVTVLIVALVTETRLPQERKQQVSWVSIFWGSLAIC